MENQICYCFGYSAEDITRDVRANNGRSLIIERMLAEKKGGGCNCGTNHPLGRRCLADVRRVVDKAKAGLKNA